VLIPNATNPSCQSVPEQVMGYGLSSNEGTQPEGNSTITNTTAYCEAVHSQNGGPSLFVVGTRLTADIYPSKPALVAYADAKLILLGEVVKAGPIAPAAQRQLIACLVKAGVLLTIGQFAAADSEIQACDQLVVAAQSSYGSSPQYPNILGDVLSRLQTAHYIVNTLIEGHTTNTPLTTLGGGG